MHDNLPQLRDIHLPPDVSWWPIAYGWWLIVALIVLGVCLFYLIKYLRKKSKKLYAMHLLKNIQNDSAVLAISSMSEILRRICIYKYPQAVSLTGEEWAGFLLSKTKAVVSDKAKEILLNSPYMPKDAKGISSQDVEEVRHFCASWIGENL